MWVGIGVVALAVAGLAAWMASLPAAPSAAAAPAIPAEETAAMVRLLPVLQVQPDTTIARFDAEHPDRADYLIGPAMSRDDDPQVMEWLNRQAASGATIVGICAAHPCR